jgi:hypothetical protein
VSPPFPIYDYVSEQGRNEFKDWSSKLQKTERAKLNHDIDKLMLYGESLYPRLPTDSEIPGILKIKITAANVQLRPLLCRGPVNPGKEFTFLLGAKERGSKWSPRNAPTTADRNKTAIVANPAIRRREHERVL